MVCFGVAVVALVQRHCLIEVSTPEVANASLEIVGGVKACTDERLLRG